MTLVKMLEQAGLAPAHRIFELTSTKVENDKGTWYAPSVKKVDETSKSQLAAAYKWYKTVSAGNVRVDESSGEEESEASAGTREY